MELLIVSSPRTGSILLQWALGLKYDLIPVQLHYRPKINSWTKGKESQFVDKSYLLDYIKTEIHNSQSQKNTVTKFEAGNMSLFPYSYELIPLEYFNFSRYNKIIFLERKNQVDRLCSRIVANKIFKWHYSIDDPPLEHIKPITFSIRDYYRSIEMHLLDDICLKIIKKYCKDYDIACEFFYYENIHTWIQSNIKETPRTMATNYCYDEIFTNYDEIESYIEDSRSAIITKFITQNPQYQELLR